MVRVLVYDDYIVAIAGHIVVVVSFVAYPDVTYSHGRDKSKGYQGFLELILEPVTINIYSKEHSLDK